MGRPKTERSRETSALLKAQKMAEAFAKHKGQAFLAQFLDETSLAQDLYTAYLATKQTPHTLTLEQFVTHALKDYEFSFAGILALAYAMGYMDHTQGKSIKELYVPRSLMPVPRPDEKPEGGEQLTLPGID